ncbi:RNA polymerase sigma factor [Mesobacillus jeotgali]|jgi:RNA polymerase sigma factor (sigma-70 family)|uniref:RNA polymerase sigma factor n=1 Tax=Mesobacillus jeotgali TaxID=129985 RepID=A0ABY9VHG3_9BACI|nr:RNA polymerase sigma factor [Mesobacillus jeotgali]WNF22266.1 RNA polymerase sigma factor [Mesobacillus jeotgali]
MNQTNLHQHNEPVDSNLAFKQLYDLHKKNVFAMALSILRDSSLAEDVLQETFIKLYQHQKLQDIPNVKAWLLSVSRNASLDLYRRKKREITGFDEQYFDQEYCKSTDPLDRMILMKYLELLDSEERQIVVLKDISGLKHREIAKIIEMPLGTVLWKYQKALNKLRKSID